MVTKMFVIEKLLYDNVVIYLYDYEGIFSSKYLTDQKSFVCDPKAFFMIN